MKILNRTTFVKYVANSSSTDYKEIYVLFIKANEYYELINCYLLETNETSNTEEVVVPLLENISSVYLSRNSISESALEILWEQFPAVWWVDLSYNAVQSLAIQFPLALGLLNLCGNKIDIEANLSCLSSLHILRLHLSIPEDMLIAYEMSEAAFIAIKLPNVWVINDDYITKVDKVKSKSMDTRIDTQFAITILSRKQSEDTSSVITDNVTNQASSVNDSGLSSTHIFANIHSSNLMRAIQECPLEGIAEDEYRLDILLEDYYQQAAYFNHFAENNNMSHHSQHGRIQYMPIVDLYSLVKLPHRLRLDLTAVLTSSLLMSIPKSLLRDALAIQLSNYISMTDIEFFIQLPKFVKTALVSILRRISKKEKDDLSYYGHLKSKSIIDKDLKKKQIEFVQCSSLILPELHYMSYEGFYFLRTIKAYLDAPLDYSKMKTNTSSSEILLSSKGDEFTALELEILDKLPDIPNSACLSYQKKEDSIPAIKSMDWVSFAARHTVLILTKSPSCPPLTRVQRSKAKQDLYIDLLPLLRAASMTLSDLDIHTYGPGKDGRILSNRTKMLGIRRPINDRSKDRSLGDDIEYLGARMLPFGAGLPNASPADTLSWKVQEVSRPYPTPWKEESDIIVTDEVMDDDNYANASLTFLTSNDLPRNNNMATRTIHSTSAFSINQFSSLGSIYDTLNVPLAASSVIPLPRVDLNVKARDGRHIQDFIGDVSKSKELHDILEEQVENLKLVDPQSNTMTSVNEFSSSQMSEGLQPALSLTSMKTTDRNDSPQKAEGIIDDDDYGSQRLMFTSDVLDSVSKTVDMSISREIMKTVRIDTAAFPEDDHHFKDLMTNINREHLKNSRIARPVCGFSADANWKSCFVLAPPRAINHANYLSIHGNEDQRDLFNYWDVIERPPVIVHTPTTRIPFQTVLNSIPLREVGTINVQDSILSDNQAAAAEPSQSTVISEASVLAALPTLQETVGQRREQLLLFDDESTLNESKSQITESKSLSLIVDDIRRRSFVQDKSINSTQVISKDPIVTKSTTLPLNKEKDAVLTIKPDETELPKFIPKPERNIADDAMSLLRDMGTVRNMRKFIESKNKSMSIIHGKPQPKSEQKVEIPLIPTFWATRQRTQNARVKSSDDSGTFLTGINNDFEEQQDEEDEDPKPNTSPAVLYGNDENSMDLNKDLEHLDHVEDKKTKSLHKSISTPANIQQHPLLPLINSVSTLDLLKIRQNYSKIYTSSQAVEYGDVSVHGAAISQTWYPVLEKPLYRLQNGSLNPQSLLSKSGTMKKKSMIQSPAVSRWKHTTDGVRNTALRKNNRRSISPKVFENNILEDIDVTPQMEMIHITTANDVVDRVKEICIPTSEDNDIDADTLGDINDNAYFAALLRPKKKNNKASIRNNFNIAFSKQNKEKRLSSGGYLASSRLKNGGTNQIMLKNESMFIPIKVTMKITDEDMQGDDKKSQGGDNSIDDSSMNSKTTEGIQNILHTYQSSISANSMWDMSSDESMRNKSKLHQYLRINSPFKEPIVHLSPEYMKPLSPLTMGRATDLRVTAVGNIISQEDVAGNTKSRSSFRYPGQPNHPWQGQSQHRAATHKVQLNRNFKYTVPIQADRNLEA